jgi:hypothetical protein
MEGRSMKKTYAPIVGVTPNTLTLAIFHAEGYIPSIGFD